MIIPTLTLLCINTKGTPNSFKGNLIKESMLYLLQEKPTCSCLPVMCAIRTPPGLSRGSVPSTTKSMFFRFPIISTWSFVVRAYRKIIVVVVNGRVHWRGFFVGLVHRFRYAWQGFVVA